MLFYNDNKFLSHWAELTTPMTNLRPGKWYNIGPRRSRRCWARTSCSSRRHSRTEWSFRPLSHSATTSRSSSTRSTRFKIHHVLCNWVFVWVTDKKPVQYWFIKAQSTNILVKLGFSSDGNFWQTDKQSSSLTSEQTDTQSSGSKFQQNSWQKFQFNTDLVDLRHRYLYRNRWHY